MTISKFFGEILENPAIYIGHKSISRLKAFMDGYMIGIDQTNPSTEHFNRPFNDWIAKRFCINTTHNWADIILFMSGNDEIYAFDMTKELWEEYKAESKA